MARFRRAARTSRTLTALVVVAVFIGAAVQWRRLHDQQAAKRGAAVNVAAANTGIAPSAVIPASAQPKVDASVVSAPTTQPALASAGSHTAGFVPLVSTTPTLGDAAPARGAIPAMAVSLMPTAPPAAPVAPPAAAFSDSTATASTVSFTQHPLADAQASFANGDLVSARKTLNDALEAGTLSPADAVAAKQHIAQINQTLIFSTDKFVDDPFGGVVVVKPGQLLSSIAKQQKLNWQLLCDLNHLSDPRKLRSGQRLKVLQGPFNAVVNKHDFTMDLYLGGAPGSPSSMYVRTFAIGLGRDNSTPSGTWMIANRVKNPTYYSPRGEGVIDAGDPKNPLGPCWMGLTGTDGQAVGKESYGIHGTIEPDSIGHMASMGCIRMHNEDALAVFQLLTEGKSTVVVRD